VPRADQTLAKHLTALGQDSPLRKRSLRAKQIATMAELARAWEKAEPLIPGTAFCCEAGYRSTTLARVE
jgi:hypothetical protein